MNKKSILFKSIALTSVFVLNMGLYISLNRVATELDAYSTTSLPTTIDLNDCTEQEIRSYYSGLNLLDASERQGANLLKNLKPILKNGQKYYKYDSDSTLWKIYEITDRDWNKSPASTISGYNSSTNKITDYSYGSSYSSPGTNPYIHALYVDRNTENLMRAWKKDDDSYNRNNHGNNAEWYLDREHIWPKSAGFETPGAGGARGDPMHLWPGDSAVNSDQHSNYFYGNVKTISSSGKWSYATNNKMGSSSTFSSYSSINVFEPQDCDKGDIARACFYMVARYNYLSGSDDDGIDSNNPNLELVNNVTDFESSGYESTTTTTGKLGILQDLLEWNRLDPPDQFEIHRNNLCYNNYTGNRNPFIDFPSWADAIWGTSENGNYNPTPTKSASPTSDPINTFVANTFSISQNSLELEIGDTAEIYGSNANSGITWSIDDNTVASLDKNSTANNETVTITALKSGSATITATSGGDNVTCTVTVTEPINYGTLENPLTVDEAISAISLGGGGETAQPLYVKGIMTSNSAYNESFKNYDYGWLQNDNGTVEQAFELYRFKLDSGVSGSFTAANSMAGKEVVAYGYGKFYNSTTYELSTSSNTPKSPIVYSITEPVVPGPSVDDCLDNSSPYIELLAAEGTDTCDDSDSIVFENLGLADASTLTTVDFDYGTLTFSKATGSNDPKYYNNGKNARLYKANTLTISSTKVITNVEFSFTTNYSSVLTASVGTLSEGVWTGNSYSVTFTNANTNSNQIRFTAISITVSSVVSPAVRFGMSIPKSDWNTIRDEYGISDYGIMVAKENTIINTYGVSSIEEAYDAGEALKISRVSTYRDPASLDEDTYAFTVKMNMSSENNYEIVYHAAAFVVVNDQYYFLDDMAFSINSLASAYLTNGGSSLSNKALTLLSVTH